MGSGASTQPFDVVGVIRKELEKPSDGSDLHSSSAEEVVAEAKYLRALVAGMPVRVAKLLSLTADKLKEHNSLVLAATVKREAQRKKDAEALARRNDYSNVFSGTADDTKNEAEAASLLKGGDGASAGGTGGIESGEFAILNPLPSDLDIRCVAALEKHGTWLRFMNPSNSCWSYIHSLTLEITGIKPEAFVEEKVIDDSKEKAKIETPGPLEISASELPEHIERVAENTKKTLLILDGTRDEEAVGSDGRSPLLEYFQQRGTVADLSGFGMAIGQQRKRGFKAKTATDEARKKLVAAIKSGLTCAIYIGDISGDDMSIPEKLCKKPLGGPLIFPATLLLQSGRGIFNNQRYARLFRDEDKDSAGGCMFKIAFKTVVVSNFSPQTYTRELKNAFHSLDDFEVIHVVP